MSAAIVFDEIFKDHHSAYPHPERPERLEAAKRGLMAAGVWETAVRIPLREATRDELSAVHTRDYVENVLRLMEEHMVGNLDGDTFFSEGTPAAALNAAGSGIDLARAVHDRTAAWGFALVRPPGHHATPNRSCGFCIFNNIAAAAAALIRDGRAKKVAILDWDVHHGNGTQDQFYNRNDVLFFSMHQWPHFPGSGLSEEVGEGAGKGTTINLPFPSGSTEGDFVSAIEKIFLPALHAFQPDHILVSAGFDAHQNDMLAGLSLRSQSYGTLAAITKKAADELCGGRVTLFLEGGYDLGALTESVEQVAAALEGASPSPLTTPNPTRAGARIIEQTIDAITPWWPGIF